MVVVIMGVNNMVNIKLSKSGRIAFKVLIYSLFAMALSSITVNLLLDFGGKIITIIYGICYVVIFASIYLVLISLVILIYQLIRSRIKPKRA